MKSDDLYLLQDGTHADPADVSRGKDGVLRHANGLAVALYEDGSPQRVGNDAKANKNVEAAAAGKEPPRPAVPEPPQSPPRAPFQAQNEPKAD